MLVAQNEATVAYVTNPKKFDPHNFKNLQSIGFPKDKTLFAGLVEGINVWKTNIKYAVNTLDRLSKWTDDLVVTNAGPLYHLPVTIEGETHFSHFLFKHLSFATEKLQELNDIKNKDTSKYSKYVGEWNNMVGERVDNLKDNNKIGL